MPTAPSAARTRAAPRLTLLSSTLSLALLSAGALAQTTTPTPSAAASDRHAIDLEAQPLPQALLKLSAQTGLQVLYGGRIGDGVIAPAVKGDYSAEQALQRLLQGSGLIARRTGVHAITLEQATAPAGAIVTDTLKVAGDNRSAGGEARDQRGRDAVYDLDLSSAYIGRTEVERYKGTTPSDLVKGVAGVFSGDARNSGALDLNIRGIQGPGRVPVSIDGTEQALTVWRGYNGASNRNYIDPFLIGGVQILKGPSLTRNVNTGIGGAMVINTLDVDDILDAGQRFGGELRVEGSSNATRPRLPTLHTGQDYRTVPDFPQATPNIPYTDPTLMIKPRGGGGGYNVFSGKDVAYRLALGWRPTQDLDLLAAYAYRERGNYFSGKHGAGYYSQPRSSSADDYILSMANYWLPGNEVPNTSSQMESWLFKATWRPTDSQALQLGYRDSLSHYGEVMPSRIIESKDRAAIQWPLSRVDAQAWNLEYTWRPADSRWIDLYANLWRTSTESDTYTAGGFPNFANPYWQTGDGASPIIRNTALANASNARNGLTFSNKIALADTLDLTLGGSFQHEKLRSRDPYFGTSDGWRMYPRAGRRQEWQANFNLEWRPVDFLTLSGGARYASYWAFDDFLAAHPGQIRQSVATGYDVHYKTTETYTQQQREALVADNIAGYKELLDLGIFTQEEYDEFVAFELSNVPTTYQVDHHAAWTPDGNGDYTKAGNPCLNGSVAAMPGTAGITCFSDQVYHTMEGEARKRKDHGWVPFFSVTAHLSDDSRAYFRYGETLRYPSMFESTVAFSASLNPWNLKPEHAYDWELAYVHDFGPQLGTDTIADIKLAYYVNKTRDVIERDPSFKFDNIDKQIIRGLEFQGRYDSGSVFTDLGVSYTLKNQVCDQTTAARLSVTNGYVIGSGRIVPNCVDYGFVGGYLLTQSTPKLSASWSLGTRLMQRRLELGSRVTYYREYRNQDLEWFRDNSVQKEQGAGRLVYTFNVPFSWGNTLLLDAYARYALRKNLSLELGATNLTDRYYVDPATRSAMAAPGRTLKLSLTGRF
ncbi:TonB-dependent receptor [Pseudoxanthomonas winnipegensis]|uniref:TonB-dependent receptor n=1 Tax=Pseudoxanthomonas winnipegensis TaxID=2480810 RepID=A0A4Q8LL95_9GAMM|nr:TonB-dependent receptor [Pseudoxanthomonas winnipegensis]TAA31315.1 TonB-dependent receptor [Pseudoxanthomonas winnipegensis]TAA41193.1 TonB-dependent receptor [Pseudoxanthomonas winnipegensis]TBV77380.1 TonB-dependent receptor [Pseudoxanthomonas winnipegensis]